MPGTPLSHALVLTDWQSFYVLVGSSAAALTGLTFVVVTIAAEDGDMERSASARLSGMRVFITPIAVHFGFALWLSALMCIPWRAAAAPAALLIGTGSGGVIYCARLIGRMLAGFSGYKPFASDWIWSAALPLTAYLALAATGFMLPRQPGPSLYAVSGVVLLLLFIGIHNAWDVVIWVTTERHARKERQRRG